VGDYEKAIAYGQQRLQLAQDQADPRAHEQSLSSLGVAYEALGDYENAILHYEERLILARQTGDRRIEQQALGSLRTTCYAMGDYGRLMKYQSGEVTGF
jgi:tetratricopeptide (TPR) repeat protein